MQDEIPQLNISEPIVEQDETGKLTPFWQAYFNKLNLFLRMVVDTMAGFMGAIRQQDTVNADYLARIRALEEKVTALETKPKEDTDAN